MPETEHQESDWLEAAGVTALPAPAAGDRAVSPVEVVTAPRQPYPLPQRLFYRAARAGLDLTGLTLSMLGKLAGEVRHQPIDTTEVSVEISDLPEAFDGLRVAQLSDIHYGSFLGPEGIERLVALATGLRPDLILLTGDYVNRWPDETRQVIPLLAKLTAPLGVYAVLGNHDHYAGAAETVRLLSRHGIKPLDHDTEAVQLGGDRLWLLGAGDYIKDRRYDLNERLAALPPEEPRLVLAHNPDTADLPRSHRVDLMLSGHTHGGQIRLPRMGAPVLPVYNRLYDQGLFRLADMQLFVSRGLGMVGLPIRLNCPPHLPVLRLVSAPKPELQ